MKLLPASIVVTTYNRPDQIVKCIDSLLVQNYPKFEMIVVDDSPPSVVKKISEKYRRYKNVKIIRNNLPRGPAPARNIGIRNSKYPLLALTDDDCVLDKNWLRDLASFLLKNQKENVAAVSSISIYAGHSNCYLKDVVLKAGLFDTSFTKAYRDDTDLAFRIMDLGYKFLFSKKGRFIHNPLSPKTFVQKLKYMKKRILVHEADCLLFKKHPERTKKFLNVQFRVVSPIDDFKRATGLWKEGGKLELSSPQGITILKANPLTIPLIVVAGVFYAVSLFFVRMYGSIKYRTFLL